MIRRYIAWRHRNSRDRRLGKSSRGQRGTGRLPPGRLVSPDAEMQVHPAALPLDLIDLALAVLLAASLERQHLDVPWDVLELGQ